ncbi:cytochrome c [Cryomorphaceae bacterium 1068]|nr:cytochrome c [Cryomorphaceae bacterium 1068]
MRNLSFILFFCLLVCSCGGGSSSQSADEKISGPKIYKTHCAICHGDDGRKGFADAKVLPKSALTLEERILLITNGRNTMMPYSGVLSEDEIEAVAQYTLSLK